MPVPESPPRGIAWAGAVNLVGGVSGSLIGLLLAGLVGRQLGTEGAGTYFLVVAVFMIVSNVAELGADTGLVRFVAAARATDRLIDVPHLVRIAIRPVLLCGVMVVVAVTAAAIAGPNLIDGLTPTFIVIGAVLAVLGSLNAVMVSVSRGFGDVLTYPLLQNITLPGLRLVGVAVVLAAGGGVTAVLTAWMLPVVVVLAAATIIAIKLISQAARSKTRSTSVEEQRHLSGQFWGFSAARGVAAAVEILLEWADVLLVGVMTSPREAGIYAVVTRCARASEVIHTAVRIAVGPQIAAAMARKAYDEAKQIYGLTTAAMIWMGWPFFIVLAVFGDAVLSVFGPGFSDGAVSLGVLSIAMALALAAGTVQTILLMGGRSSWQLADKTFALVLNVGLNLALIPLWGIEGAALAWAVTIIVDTAIVVYQVQNLMHLRPDMRLLATAAAVSLIFAGVPVVASRLIFGSSVPIMLITTALVAVLYLAVSWPLRQRLGLTALLAHRS
ncbi:oligosaccharide flippase family protein [Aeromicrobium sp. P5_D10]